jgi:putative ABC transport system substrate-binding protein
MRRREVIALIGGGALASMGGAARAQTVRARGKIGYLHPRTIASDSPTLAILRPAWEKLGYAEGESVLLRSAESDPRQLPRLAAELTGLGAGVLIVVGSAAVRAASQVAATPVVAIDLETDPVRTGLAASFRRPGGNVTGLFLDQPSLAGKWIGLLREAAPDLARVAIIWDPATSADQLDVAQAAARAGGLEALALEIANPDQYEEAFRKLGSGARTGVMQLGSPGFIVAAASFADAARRHRLPTISFLKAYAKAGVLMSYGPNQQAYWPRAIILADRILKGEAPADLPIEQPTEFELAINLGTAKALGLDIPPTLLARADEVIE